MVIKKYRYVGSDNGMLLLLSVTLTAAAEDFVLRRHADGERWAIADPN